VPARSAILNPDWSSLPYTGSWSPRTAVSTGMPACFPLGDPRRCGPRFASCRLPVTLGRGDGSLTSGATSPGCPALWVGAWRAQGPRVDSSSGGVTRRGHGASPRDNVGRSRTRCGLCNSWPCSARPPGGPPASQRASAARPLVLLLDRSVDLEWVDAGTCMAPRVLARAAPCWSPCRDNEGGPPPIRWRGRLLCERGVCKPAGRRPAAVVVYWAGPLPAASAKRLAGEGTPVFCIANSPRTFGVARSRESGLPWSRKKMVPTP